MSVILHISDPHFGTEQLPVARALMQLAERVEPDLVVLSGDITQRARSAQFRAARGFMDRLPAPRLVLPGNHDIPLFNLWARLWNPYARHRAAFGDTLEPAFNSSDLLVLGVNTTRPGRHKNGEVSSAQVARVAGQLARATPQQLRVVVVHQPIEVLRPQDAHDRLIGHTAAQEAWAAAGADIVLGGHIHLPYVMALPALPRPMWAVQAGTAVSSRVRPGAPNSVNLVRWDAAEGSCVVEQWDHAVAEQAFVQVRVTRLQPER
ncbi:metallophosphoesterase family protein [Hydrogenophaga laconesensis]|uniref:3',5'-cyclic AMP phosphodiesterase CpdA n=1 Tax=Hydrogenophaga laconesensis TaxID=1805971 RepID=A0ABU1V8C6_9BURK|nr:metallophosphoesterase [Hydrogenophaga laconesensis]MDR7093714.1 3',5'-cyclic AMP phosphodiesterase CpdA [Hydrogenophaga laconesensis]